MLANSKKGRRQTSPATRESSYRTTATPDVSSLDDVGDEPATGGGLFKQRRLNRRSLAYWCQDEVDEEIVPAGERMGRCDDFCTSKVYAGNSKVAQKDLIALRV